LAWIPDRPERLRVAYCSVPLVFAAEASISKAVLVGILTSSLTLALLAARVLDFPFESALQLPSRDFNATLEKVDHLIAVAQPHGSRASE
jgi:hypothetical protein